MQEPSAKREWSGEEEEYLRLLVHEFNDGTMSAVTNGTIMVYFLARMLQCGVQRLANKVGYGELNPYQRQPEKLTQNELHTRQVRLVECERRFWRSAGIKIGEEELLSRTLWDETQCPESSTTDSSVASLAVVATKSDSDSPHTAAVKQEDPIPAETSSRQSVQHEQMTLARINEFESATDASGKESPRSESPLSILGSTDPSSNSPPQSPKPRSKQDQAPVEASDTSSIDSSVSAQALSAYVEEVSTPPTSTISIGQDQDSAQEGFSRALGGSPAVVQPPHQAQPAPAQPAPDQPHPLVQPLTELLQNASTLELLAMHHHLIQVQILREEEERAEAQRVQLKQDLINRQLQVTALLEAPGNKPPAMELPQFQKRPPPSSGSDPSFAGMLSNASTFVLPLIGTTAGGHTERTPTTAGMSYSAQSRTRERMPEDEGQPAASVKRPRR